MKNMLVRFFLLLLCCAVSFGVKPALAFSLFYAPEQVRTIDEEVKKNPRHLTAQSKHLVHLSSILYAGRDDWTVWLSGEKWTPQTHRKRLQIISVAPDEIVISLFLQGEKQETLIPLKPHQSVNLLTGAVIEGF